MLMVPEMLLRFKTRVPVGEYAFVLKRSLESLCVYLGGRQGEREQKGEGESLRET